MTQSDQSPDPIQRAHDQVRQTIADVGGIVDGIAERVKGIVNETMRAIFEPLGAALQAQLQVFGELVTGLLENLATPGDIVGGAWDKWNELAAKDNGPGTALTRWMLSNFGGAWGKQIMDTARPPDNNAFQGLAAEPPNVPHVGAIFEDFKSKPGWYQSIWYFFFTITLVGAYGNALISSDLSALEQDVAAQTPVTPLSADQLAQAVVQSQVPQDWAAHEVKRVGLTDELFDLLVKIQGMPPGLSEMLSLLNREVVDEDAVRQAIAESHTKTKYTDALLKLRFAIPTIGEITHWLTRDAFIDDFVQRYGMDAEYDLSAAQADPLFKANAVSPDYVKFIWRSHWTLPSPGAGAEMFYRTAPDGVGETIQLPGGGSTKRIISRDDLQRLYRAAGFEPWWRDPLLKIAFNPLTRIDSRRMYLANLIDDGEFYRSQLNIGYDETTAQMLLTWMQAQKADSQKKQAEKHIAPITHSLRQMYQRGLIGAGELKAQAVALGEDPDVVDVWTAQLDTERATERAVKIRDGLHRLVVDGFVTEDEAGQRLQAEGFTSAEWMRLRDDWRVDQELRQHSDDAKATRALTRAQLVTAYKDQLIQRDELVGRLKVMGYHDDEITLWIELADFEEQQRVANVARESIRADYVDQLIDVVTARSQLHDLHVPDEHVEALLRRWTSERRRKTPNLSVGQIESAFKNEVIDESRSRDMLASMRYTPDEVDVLIGNWRLEVGISSQRLQLEQERFAFQQQRAAQQAATQETQFEARQSAQQSRLAQQESFAQAQQARTLEAQTARAAQAFERQQVSQSRTIQAAADRQQKALDAATARAQAAAAQRDRLAAAALQARQAAQAATDARQQKALTAAADRQQAAFEQQDKIAQLREQERIAAEQRTQGFKIAAEQRAQQAEQAKEQRLNALRIQTELRSHRRALEHELRQQSFTIAKEQRQSAARMQAEQRVSERKAALATATAQAESTVANLRQQQAASQGQTADDMFNQAVSAAQQQIGSLPTGL